MAIVRERPVVSGVLLGLGLAAKLWPAVLLPIGVVYLWRRRGRRAGLVLLGSFVAAAAACFLPFAVLAPDGVRAMFADQLNRPLQVESLGSAVLMAAQRFGMRPLHTINSHGAQALSGRGAGLAADLSTVLEVATVAAIWVIFARRRNPDGEAVLLAAGGGGGRARGLRPRPLAAVPDLDHSVRPARAAASAGSWSAAFSSSRSA